MQSLEINKAGPISSVVTTLVNNHIKTIGKNKVENLYALVMEAIEPALFKTVLAYSNYNKSKAARYLGINRETLRERLITYFGDAYVGRRSKVDDDDTL